MVIPFNTVLVPEFISAIVDVFELIKKVAIV